MSTGSIRWGEDQERGFGDAHELNAILDELQKRFLQERPTLVEVEIASGDSLAIGLGNHEGSLLSFVAGTGTPPYYISHGSDEREGTTVFYFSGEWSEFPSYSLIPMDIARKAIEEFVDTGRLSDLVKWEEG